MGTLGGRWGQRGTKSFGSMAGPMGPWDHGILGRMGTLWGPMGDPWGVLALDCGGGYSSKYRMAHASYALCAKSAVQEKKKKKKNS